MSLVESTIQNILPSISVILGECIFDVIAGIVEYLLPIIIVGGILSINGKALDDDGDNTYNLYKNFAFGVAFNVSDDLAVSYGEWKATKAGYTCLLYTSDAADE